VKPKQFAFLWIIACLWTAGCSDDVGTCSQVRDPNKDSR
jgi:hypothetical protein